MRDQERRKAKKRRRKLKRRLKWDMREGVTNYERLLIARVVWADLAEWLAGKRPGQLVLSRSIWWEAI